MRQDVLVIARSLGGADGRKGNSNSNCNSSHSGHGERRRSRRTATTLNGVRRRDLSVTPSDDLAVLRALRRLCDLCAKPQACVADVNGSDPWPTFVLRTDGTAERRVRYAGTSEDDLFVGSFEITSPAIVFSLQPQPPAAYVWTLHGEWSGERFSVRYPDPADGPDIIETFRR